MTDLPTSAWLAHAYCSVLGAWRDGRSVSGLDLQVLADGLRVAAEQVRALEGKAAGVASDLLSTDADPLPEPIRRGLPGSGDLRTAEPSAAASLVAFAKAGEPGAGLPCAVVLPFPRGGGHGR